jgi:uracil-DNA glycosylase
VTYEICGNLPDEISIGFSCKNEELKSFPGIFENLPEDYKKAFSGDFSKLQNLDEFLQNEYNTQKIYPPKSQIFRAFELTPLHTVKAVIIGQDPYHGENQANGLSFAVNNAEKTPPSLKNIFKEVRAETGEINTSPDLIPWAEQGILLMNSVLTVRAGEPNSHKGKGWEEFTDAVITLLNNRTAPTVFMLWGANAAQKSILITNPQHLLLTAKHPSPLSANRGFFGCGHFNQMNAFLKQNDISPIIL